MSKISYTSEDFSFDWFSGTGAGGQHRNKHQNCLRLTHNKTGITVIAQSSRSRTANKREAFDKMIELLYLYHNPKKEKTDVTEVVRSYKIEDNLVVDHLSGTKYTVTNLDNINLTEMMIANKLGRLNNDE